MVLPARPRFSNKGNLIGAYFFARLISNFDVAQTVARMRRNEIPGGGAMAEEALISGTHKVLRATICVSKRLKYTHLAAKN